MVEALVCGGDVFSIAFSFAAVIVVDVTSKCGNGDVISDKVKRTVDVQRL
jgi:hypothetical protein